MPRRRKKPALPVGLRCPGCRAPVVDTESIGGHVFARPCGCLLPKPARRGQQVEMMFTPAKAKRESANRQKPPPMYSVWRERQQALQHVQLSETCWTSFVTPLPSVANQREHWAVKAKRTAQHRTAAFRSLQAAHGMNTVPALPLTVILTRVAPRPLDDDNLARAFKATRDGVSDFLGVEDDHPQIRWVYRQARGQPKQTLAQIELVPEA